MKIQILRGYAETLLSRTFNSAIREFHYFKRYWSPEKAKKLICIYEENNAFDVLAIKTCKEDGKIIGHLPCELSIKLILDRGARILAVLESTHYRKSPLVQGGVEIPCQVTMEISPTFKDGQLLDRLIQLVEIVYCELMPPIILGSFLADEIEVKCKSNKIRKTNSFKATKRKNSKEKRSFDIIDIIRQQNENGLKR